MVLIFNSCFDTLYLGLVLNDKVISTKKIPSKRQHSEIMVDAIDVFLKENNTTINNLEKIFFANGPGGFTGIRLGVVFAKTQNLISNVEILTLDSLSSLISNETGIISIDARSGKFYTANFVDGKMEGEIYITLKDKSTLTPNDKVVSNMFNKIHLAQTHKTFDTINIDYIKKI